MRKVASLRKAASLIIISAILLSTFVVLAPKTSAAYQIDINTAIDKSLSPTLCVPNQDNLMITVIDAATLNPIIGANISIQGPETHWNITGNNGNWTFYNITAGSYTVTASMVGYFPNATSVCVYQTQTNCTLSLQAVPNQGNLMVKVVDAATSSPIVGANVSIQGPETHWNITGNSGNWTFYNVTSGTYNVTATMIGYLPNSTLAIVNQGLTTNCTLSLHAVSVPNQGNLTVTVIDAVTLNRIVGANVSIQGPETHWNITGNGGNWTFYNVTAGSYNVTASMTGYLSNSTSAVVFQGQTTNCALSLAVAVLRDVAVTEVVPDADWVYQGKLCHAGVNVTVANFGEATENFTVSLYALNTTAIPANVTIGNQLVTNLPPNGTLVLRFVWNSTGAQASHLYNITAVASTVPGEANITNNVMSSLVLVKVRLFGDVNDDGKVDILDAIVMANAFGSRPGDKNWNLAADVSNDGLVNILDTILIGASFRIYVGSDP